MTPLTAPAANTIEGARGASNQADSRAMEQGAWSTDLLSSNPDWVD
jgi:hypothetical protein